ncbi:MAG TPA: sensor histidine kinase [Solirubrobacteraceae bacterium]|jgi:anti-sigma regulatory factor (Ser/Thr protein kinase)|nr:sensor histidine kinase [Solirubrobacteraceae bacterium]
MAVTTDTFVHEALLYEGVQGFVDGTLPFLREGLDAGEPMLVVVGPEKIARLRAALDADADAVRFVDMTVLGRNPGRIISAWWDFVDEYPDRPIRGIGEPVWADRSAAELVECQLHESLLNLAFGQTGPFRLMCPYDVAALGDGPVHEARCSHPLVDSRASAHYRGAERLLSPFEAPLPAPVAPAGFTGFDAHSLDEVRSTVADWAGSAGLSRMRTGDLVLAVNEAAANSVIHGGGHGVLRAWSESGSLVCEVRDRGRITDPLVGRRRPAPDATSGRGVWIVHQACDLVQLRSGADGTVVRMHMAA